MIALSPREYEIALLINEGFKNKDIAQRLNLSLRTVECHREHIYKKLDVHGVAQLVRKLLSGGVYKVCPTCQQTINIQTNSNETNP